MQANWANTDTSSWTYIQNKPPLVYVPDTNNTRMAGNVSLNSGNLIVSGNVGIGTYLPAYALDVSGTCRASNFIGNGSGLTGLPSNPWTSTGSYIYYNGGYNVGIGTATPTSTLSVNGSLACGA